MSARYGLPTCTERGCKGHLAKFPTCRTEALWTASLDGHDESTGSTEAHGFYSLMIFPEAEDIDISDAQDGSHVITVPSGQYIVECQESGAVYHSEYDTEHEAREAFAVEVNRYADWENQCGICGQQREADRADAILCLGCEIRDVRRNIATRTRQANVILAARGLGQGDDLS